MNYPYNNRKEQGSMKFDDKGLLPAIVQDEKSGDVLMLAYMNQEAIDNTLSSKQAWFYSRSRQEMWHKGATSGNFLNVKKRRPRLPHRKPYLLLSGVRHRQPERT